MPDEIKYMVIEPGTQVRVKIIGTRTEVGEMWAIGSIHGDFLGYALMCETIAAALVNLRDV
jgi:DNA-directed RNA polymerase II subunit RPB7